MIIITGAAGFIGSCLACKLNSNEFFDLALVDSVKVSKLQSIGKIHYYLLSLYPTLNPLYPYTSI